MTVLSPTEIINHATSGDWSLFQQDSVTDTDVNVTIRCARLDSTNNHGSGIVEAQINSFAPYFPSVTMTREAFKAGVVTAARICYAESGGDTANRHVNGPTSTAPGSIDRGLFQWNNEAWPGITDAMAYNGPIAFLLAWRVSKGWQDFSPWHGSEGLDPTSAKSKVIDATYESMTGRAVPEPLLGLSLGGILDWTKALGRLLSKLVDAAWWKRIGVGAVGVLFIVAALILAAYTAWKG